MDNKEFNRLWKELNALEYTFFHEGESNGIIPAILRSIERQTGMHESIFLTKAEHIAGMNFRSVFKTNRLLTLLLAPTHIVLGSALSHVAFINGNPVLAPVAKVRNTVGHEKHLFPDLIKSLLMNVFLALGAVVLLPFTRKATKYAVESIKWSMYAVAYMITGRRPAKQKLGRFFTRLGMDANYLGRWLYLSKKCRCETWFTLLSPLVSLKVHVLGFKMRKTNMKKSR